MSGTSTTRQGALVGCFTLIGVFILIAAVFTIGSMNDAFSSRIHVSAVFEQVDGLKKGDSVWFSGVPVGTIRSVTFLPGPSVEISMALDSNAAPFIANDVVAQVSSDGLIGNKIVVLAGGSSEADRLEDGDVIGVDVAISMAQLMAEIKETNDNLRVITASIASGEGSIGKLLTDEAMYGELRATVTSLERAAGRADAIAGNVSSFTRELNRVGALPRDLVTDQTTYPALLKAVDSLESTAASAATLMEGIEADLGDASTPVGVLLRDQQAGSDLEETFGNLNRSTRLLEEDLEALQHNFLLRGYFRKQERQERKALKKAEKAEK